MLAVPIACVVIVVTLIARARQNATLVSTPAEDWTPLAG
jgi:hypothetical protein